ncbi:class I SAM-dependent methyltransferase [Arsukibacterium sp.]|uniref:class I SAM-dependent methyltransferase n=1 Tax=Arsukibacterium sp. TaxID=1977258 RepID=UPI0035639BCB
MPSKTIDYYNQHAADYTQSTDQIDMTALYAEFLPFVKIGGHILDAGCGSGRDADYFKQQGFKVSAFDASAELARLASTRLQQAVAVQRFEQLNQHEKYHGIWCCASLLHVANNNLAAVFGLLQQALKPSGVLYASFKYGDAERQDHGRHFTDMNEARLTALISNVNGLTLNKMWLTQDQRPARNHETWLNALLFRNGS